MTKRRPAKIGNPRGEVLIAVESRRYRFTKHCLQRMRERAILRREVLYVLVDGRREPRKDEFRTEYQAWTYAFRGTTLDRSRELRVAVAFDDVLEMWVVTAIDLSRDE